MDKSAIKFGLGQVNNETPLMATWLFRGYFIISKAIIGWLGSTHLIPQSNMYEIVTFILLVLDPVMLGFSKLFGIQTEPVDDSASLLADKQIDTKGNVTTINPVVVPQPEASTAIPSPQIPTQGI